MIHIGSKILPAAYSIDLYAITLKKRNVPEEHTQIKALNYLIRRLTLERVASRDFGCCSVAKSIKWVSSHVVKQSQVSDLADCYPAGVM